MRRFMVLAAVLVGLGLLTPAAYALTADYGWENGATILGSFPENLVDPLNVATGSDPWPDPLDGIDQTVTPHGGAAMLQVTEAPHSGTPQAYLAYVEDIANGDMVTASFYGWDVTPEASPSLRIWGNYANSTDGYSFVSSAGGSDIYTVGSPDGWSQVSNTWEIAFPDDADTLVVHARLYSTPSTDTEASTDYWIDDVSATAPDGAMITFPVPEPSTWVLVVGLIASGLAVRLRR